MKIVCCDQKFNFSMTFIVVLIKNKPANVILDVSFNMFNLNLMLA